MSKVIRFVSLEKSAYEQGSQITLHLKVGDMDHELFFRTRDCELQPKIEVAVSASLLPCMALGSDFVIQGESSSQLIGNMDRLQDIITTWWGHRFRKIRISGWRPVIRENTPGPARVGVFFSGGVDSFHTLVRNIDEITDLIFVHGFDIALEHTALREKTSQAIRQIGQSLGKNVIEIETNLRSLLDQYMDWPSAVAAAFAAIGHLLPGSFCRMFIASSHTYKDLSPRGCHPLLDPLWSSESLEFVHDGCESTRLQKVVAIAENAVALQYLRVCWRNTDGAYNCGKCEKCLRTMIGLQIAGALERCATLPQHIDIGKLRLIDVPDEDIRCYVRELISELERMRGDRELIKALSRMVTGKNRRRIWIYNMLRNVKRITTNT